MPPPHFTWRDGSCTQPADPRSATDTESERSRAASPAILSVYRSPANSVSSKDSNSVIDAGNGLAPNDLIPPTVRSSWEPRTASPDNLVTRKDTGVNLNKKNVSRIGSFDRWSRLNDYLSDNPEDPWNQEWVVYAARTPLPGEASYLLETGEPATTSPRRRYDQRRRAEVAFTRKNGGACEPCRRRHRACPHRLQQRLQELAAVVEGDATTSEQLGEGVVTQRAIDAVRFDVTAGIGPSSQLGEATSHESSARGRLSFPTPRREPSQRPLAHRRPWDGHGNNVTSGSSGSSRQSNNVESREPIRDFATSTPLEQTYSLGSTQRGTEGLFYMSDGAGLRPFPPLLSNEQQSLLSEQMFATHPDTFDTASNQRTTLPYESFTWSDGGYANSGEARARFSNVTDRPRLSSRNHLDLFAAGVINESSSLLFRPPETPSWPSQQASFRRDYSNEGSIGSTLSMRDFALPQTPLDDESMSVLEDQQAMPNLSDANLGWQIEDGLLLDAGPPEQIFDTALLDELPAAPDQRGDHYATQLPLAINANSQPTGPNEWIGIDLAADFAWDNPYYGGVDPSGDPPLESYAAYLGNPFFSDGQENTSWSNSEPIPTPPSNETG